MAEIKPLTKEEIDLLCSVDTPTICNVIELFDVRPRNVGYMDGRIQSCFPEMPPVVGYASTATFRSDAPPRGGDVYSSLDKQVAGFADLPGPPFVVFQDLDDPAIAATFGEVMCSTYQAFGAVGLITSGAGRDMQQVKALGFPVFTGGTICSHGYCHILQTEVPVRVGGVTVYSGDLLHADANGVTTIPHEIAGTLARLCKEFIDAEEEVLGYLKTASPPTVEGLADSRKRYSERVKEITKRAKAGL